MISRMVSGWGLLPDLLGYLGLGYRPGLIVAGVTRHLADLDLGY